MRLVLTALFICLGMFVSKSAMASDALAPVARLDAQTTPTISATACTQLEQAAKIDPATCGIYSPQELVLIKLAQEAG
ncbi:MAG: hypothetical protein AAFY90_14365 [Pseudomonadota bacterium]